MTDTVLSDHDVRLIKSGAPALRRLVPGFSENQQQVVGIKRAGYVMVQNRDERYVGYTDDQSLSRTVEFQSEVFNDAIIDLSRSFVAVSLSAEISVGGGGYAAGDLPWSYQPIGLANGAGALFMRTSQTRINGALVSEEADSLEDCAAATSFVQMLQSAKGSDVQPSGGQRVWGVPGPAEDSGLAYGIDAYNPGTFYTGVFPGYAGPPAPPANPGIPRAVLTQNGPSNFHSEGWCLCDDFLSMEMPWQCGPTFGENTVYPIGASRASAALALQKAIEIPLPVPTADSSPMAVFRAKPGSSLWRSKVALPPGCSVGLQFDISQATRYIHSQFRSTDGGAQANYIDNVRAWIYPMTMWLYIVRPDEINLSVYRRMLAAEQWLIPLVTRRVFAATPRNGATSVSYSGLFCGVVPQRLWVYLTRSHQQSGLAPRELARFSAFACSPYGRHDGIRQVTAVAPGKWTDSGSPDLIPYINRASVTSASGRQYPDAPFDSGLAVNDSIRRYMSYLSACDDPDNPALSDRSYATSYPVLCIDIDQNTAGEASEELTTKLGGMVAYSNQGLTLNLDFSYAVTQTPDPGAVTVANSDHIPPLWVIVVAESTARLDFAGQTTEQVRVERVGY